MDGTVNPDVSARYDADASLVAIDYIDIQTCDRGKVHAACANVAKEALQLYTTTGRGDLEFAVDGDGQVWWLQARVLNEPVEVVDRQGFHPAAVAYYKLLAFRVADANLTSKIFFRCFNLDGGRFGYSIGIRQRDRVFHNLLSSDPMHLDRVTSFGWDVERRMAELVAGLQGQDPAEVFNLLTLHGAVQLPFSIPMNTNRMDRFQSTARDGHPSRLLLEEFMERVAESLGGTLSAIKIIDILLQPVKTDSILESQTAILWVLRTVDPPIESHILQAIIPDLRDVPGLLGDGMAEIQKQLSDQINERRKWDPDGTKLAGDIEQRTKAHEQARARRSAFIQSAISVLDEDTSRQFCQWANYLEMKAETNETHCLYRGACFIWFGRIGFKADNIHLNYWATGV